MTVREYIEKLEKDIEYDKSLFQRFPNNAHAIQSRLDRHEHMLKRLRDRRDNEMEAAE